MIRRTILTGMALLFMSSVAQADVTGTWRTQKSKKGASISVKISKCGSSYCGTITKAHNTKEPVPIGKKMITGMKTKNGKSFYGGKIYAPDTQKWYSSKMQLNGNRLKVSGCVAKIFCRSQNWRRE